MRFLSLKKNDHCWRCEMLEEGIQESRKHYDAYETDEVLLQSILKMFQNHILKDFRIIETQNSSRLKWRHLKVNKVKMVGLLMLLHLSWNPRHPGQVRLYGRGVTKLFEKEVGVFEPCSSGATDDQLQDIRMTVEREIMEDKFEEREEASRKKFIAQFLVELHVSGAKYDANAILARMDSPGEASSAQRPFVQPIHLLSTAVETK